MINPVYNLPEIQFVGGSTEEFSFNLFDKNREPYIDIMRGTVSFSVISYSNRDYGSPLFVLSNADSCVNIDVDEVDGTYSKVHITLNGDLTRTLSGKFIYQLELTDMNGNLDIPGQGIMTIIRNVNSGRKTI